MTNSTPNTALDRVTISEARHILTYDGEPVVGIMGPAGQAWLLMMLDETLVPSQTPEGFPAVAVRPESDTMALWLADGICTRAMMLTNGTRVLIGELEGHTFTGIGIVPDPALNEDILPSADLMASDIGFLTGADLSGEMASGPQPSM